MSMSEATFTLTRVHAWVLVRMVWCVILATSYQP